MNAPDQPQEQKQEPEQPQTRALSATLTGTQIVGGAVQTKSMGELIEFAKLVAYSGMVPECYNGNPGAVIVAVQMGAELGLTPMAALQNVAVINGRPSVWGDAGLAIVRTHRDFVNISETMNEAGTVAKCVIERKGQTPVERTFSLEDARKAYLLDKKGPWQQYPKRMLQMRARWFAMRDAFPDALRGIASAEESDDMTITIPSKPAPWPQPIAGMVTEAKEEKPAGAHPAIVMRELIQATLTAFEAIGVSQAMLEKKLGRSLWQLDEEGVRWLKTVYATVKSNPRQKAEVFGAPPSAAASINETFGKPVTAPDPEVDENALSEAAAAAEAQATRGEAP